MLIPEEETSHDFKRRCPSVWNKVIEGLLHQLKFQNMCCATVTFVIARVVELKTIYEGRIYLLTSKHQRHAVIPSGIIFWNYSSYFVIIRKPRKLPVHVHQKPMGCEISRFHDGIIENP